MGAFGAHYRKRNLLFPVATAIAAVVIAWVLDGARADRHRARTLKENAVGALLRAAPPSTRFNIMHYAATSPAQPLSRFIERFWSFSDAPPHRRERIVPSGTIELVFNLRFLSLLESRRAAVRLRLSKPFKPRTSLL